MAKFTYRMQNILDIKIKLKNQAKIAYATASRQLAEEQEKLREILMPVSYTHLLPTAWVSHDPSL